MLVAYFRRNEAVQWIITLTELEEVLVTPELNLTLAQPRFRVKRT